MKWENKTIQASAAGPGHFWRLIARDSRKSQAGEAAPWSLLLISMLPAKAGNLTIKIGICWQHTAQKKKKTHTQKKLTWRQRQAHNNSSIGQQQTSATFAIWPVELASGD